MKSDPKGYLSLVLHAHLPFVRDPKHERFLEENWFYEALTETYLPTLLMLEDLIRDGVDFRLTMSLTPSLISMFEDELLQERYARKLEGLVELAEKEIDRNRNDPDLLDLARFYHERFYSLREYYLHGCGRDVTRGFRRVQETGHLEIITSAATHGFLPHLRYEPSAVRAQVELGVEHYVQRFGRQPQGFWLPECGYYPGLDEVLADYGILYFFVDTHAVLRGSTRAQYGAYAPIVCPSGVAAFPRDPECSKQVWSSTEGFPGDPDYREFYRDIGFEMPLGSIEPYIGPDGIRIQTGIKYHRVTGSSGEKLPYVRAQAMQRAAAHAGVFLKWRQEQVRWLETRMERPPMIVAPYDAELFGHWWFEGPEWLNFVLRKAAFDQDEVLTVTPSEYLAEFPESQESVPSLSTWGHRGYTEVWLNKENDWVYPKVHDASRRLAKAAHQAAGRRGVLRRLLNQAGRELLLAQASDWAFILKTGTASQFAIQRVEEGLDNFYSLLEPVEQHLEDEGEPLLLSPDQESHLTELEGRHNIFSDLRFEVFRETTPRSANASVPPARHVVFLSAEAVPYVKVGGLADVAGALPEALAQLGVRVTLVLPGYKSVDREKHKTKLLAEGLAVRVGARRVSFRVLEAEQPAPGVRVLLIDEKEHFGRDGVYVNPATAEEYPDSDSRFVFFTKAAFECLRHLGEPVDVIHSHDHQTALAGALLKHEHKDDSVLGLAASVYTLHNLGYQGVYRSEVLDLAGFGRHRSRPGTPFEHRGAVNFMKLGIHFADKVNTVSDYYAREICADPEHIGAGLGDVLRDRGDDFVGILNGIDTKIWNPSGDEHIASAYAADNLEGKRACKEQLFEDVGLDLSHIDAPLVGMITRLVDQKGLDLVAESFEALLETGVTFVVLGTGLAKYETFFADAAERYPGRVAVELRYDNGLAHKIEAGADMFLMPSLYEPCGLNQMYSLRYGTVPIVRHTGGLADTVVDDDAASGRGQEGVGFSFVAYTNEALVDTVARAVRAYEDPNRWQQIQQRGMGRDLSWGASARKYLELYRSALQTRS